MKTRFKLFRFAALALLLAAVSPSMHATTNQSGCGMALYNCYNTAANLDGFWRRTAAGFDCEVDFAACVRNALGY